MKRPSARNRPPAPAAVVREAKPSGVLAAGGVRRGLPLPAIALALICFAAFAVRLVPSYQAVHSNGEYITDPDSLYHLIRIEQTVQDYPRIPVKNRYEEYPAGSTYESPPLYPFFLATILKIWSLFTGPMTGETMRRILSFVGPLSGCFLAIAFYIFCGNFVHSRAIRLLGSLLFAILPVGINYTGYGNLDYHGLIAGLTMLFYGAVVRQRLRSAVLWLALLFGTWQAVQLQMGIVLLAAFAYAFTRKDAGLLFPFLEKVGWGTAACLFPLVLYCSLMGAPAANPAFFGWGTLLTVVAFALFCRSIARKSRLWFGASCVAMLPIVPIAWKGLLVLYLDPLPFLQSVRESAPLLFLDRHFSLRGPIYLLTPLCLITPLIGVLLFRRWRRRTEDEWTFARAFLLVAYFVHGTAAFAQARFSDLWAAFVVLLLVVALDLAGRRRRPVVLALLLINAFPVYGEVLPKGLRNDYRVLISSVSFWNTTADTPGWGRPETDPGYGVLTDWEHGTLVEYWAHRPVMIDPRGPISTDWRWAANFQLSEDEAESYRIASEHRIRYVLVRDFYSTMNIYPAWIGKRLTDYFELREGGAIPTDKLLRTTGFRLCELLGLGLEVGEQGGAIIAPLDHFRLEWLSGEDIVAAGGHTYPWWFKIYRVVPGCEMRLPGPGTLTASLTLPNGKVAPYRRSSKPDHTITLPYSSDLLRDLRVTVGDRVWADIRITPRMVEEGSRIKLQ